MENDLMDSLTDLCLEDSLEAEEIEIIKVLDEGPKSYRFTKVVAVLAQQIKILCNLEETVHKMVDNNDFTSFLLELSSFLKELGCPYRKLVTGHLSSRLQSKEDRMLLLDYLISELMAARMVHADHFKDKPSLEIVVQESTTAKDLKDILISLKFNKPPPNITPEVLFSKLEAKLKDTISKEGEQLVGKPLYNKALTEKEWTQLENTFMEMYEDYQLRKETLITRLECTIQSFEWSEKNKDKEAIQAAYRSKRDLLKPKPDVKMSDFLAARTSLLQVEKTSCARLRKCTKSEVYKVIMGKVPDRGGRPHEQQPPPPEMPSWQQRSQGGGRGGAGGGFNRGGGGGGGFGRGGYDSNRGSHDGVRSGYDSGRGTHNGGRTGYDSGRGSIDGGRGGYDSGRGTHNGGRAGYDSGRGSIDGGRAGYDSGRGSVDGGRNSFDGGRGSQDGGRGGYGGRGGRVQGAYTQGSGDRPQTSPANFNQKRNYQTYEVPSGGYNNQSYSTTSNRVDDYQHNSGYSSHSQGYNSGGYQRSGSHDSQWSSGGYGNSQGNQGYQSRGGYQNEHDDRDRRGRGGGGGYSRGGRR